MQQFGATAMLCSTSAVAGGSVQCFLTLGPPVLPADSTAAMNVVMLESLPFAACRAAAMVGKEVLPAAPVVLLASPMLGLPAAAPAGAVVFDSAGAVAFASGAVLAIGAAIVALSMPACSKMRPADAVDSTAHRHRSVTKRAIVKSFDGICFAAGVRCQCSCACLRDKSPEGLLRRRLRYDIM